MSRKKILIIDDDMTALDLIDFLFDEKGYDVARSATGQDALVQVKDFKPDAVIVDLMMPQMTGQECVRRLRSEGIMVPIVAFTAVDDPHIHREASDAGCNLILTKPCKPSILLDKIEMLLQELSPHA